ncbi:hypothetical protein CfE428DRAFT_5700 [Chthoniobacter flavus Ellin428]|uniref:Uncharacterized protein n=1 Tax=Chthoniobacter flavus Ellin428 TaxID=497964 RepID=B4D9Y3_9BACT|nr:hypothetical protein [Chthoniobacter flavus]EDY16737.1 hypothetical protein CfE428DRAFT_5700 [Chthoniobacter flavus Ellin428]TCO87854.1 hypothetical protein EV701_120153 [Chthoniobacter flavus]
MTQDGIEIHFDEKNGYLELACEPDAFAAYRNVAREHLKDFPGIPIHKIVEINIVDTATFVGRRGTAKRRIGNLFFGFVATVILALALIGAYALIRRL